MTIMRESIPLTVSKKATTSNARRCKIHGVVEFLDDADDSDRLTIRTFVMASVLIFLGIVGFIFGVVFFSAMNGVWPITDASNCTSTFNYSGDIPVGTTNLTNLTLEGNTTETPEPWFPDQLEITRERGQVLLWLELTAMLVTCLLLLVAVNHRCHACVSSIASYISFFCFLIGALVLVCCVVWPVSLKAANCVSTAGFCLGMWCFISSAIIFFCISVGMARSFRHLQNVSTYFCACCYLGSNDAYENL